MACRGLGGRFNAIVLLIAAVFMLTVSVPASAATLWQDNTVPGIADSGPDSPVELGLRFRADTAGWITGIRFYKGAGNTGTHVADLWSESGTLLATATFSNETAVGWQQVNFGQPVAISANAVYIASYHTDSGHYSVDLGYFSAQGVDNAPLHAPADSSSGANGVYAYGPAGSFPNRSFKSANYWVDMVFSTTAPAANPQATLWPNSAVPGIADSGPDSPVELGMRFRSDAAGFITGIRFYKGLGNTGSHVANLWSESGALLGTTTFSNETASGWQQANFPSPIPIAANTAYIASYHTDSGHYSVDLSYFSGKGMDAAPLHAPADGVSGANGLYAYGAAGSFPSHTFKSANYWVDVVYAATAPAPTNPQPTLWSDATVPAIADSGPDSPVELGVRFRSDAAGSITGIRFYKGSGNTGSHVANLWSDTGALLATGTFTGESASGWQQINFVNPVPISANTFYVASYHTDTGHYSVDLNYFSGKGIDNPPLHVPADGVTGANGVYAYGPAGTFPNRSFKSANYWVDVVYSSNVPVGKVSPGEAPILVVTSSANPFSGYYAEILRSEGLNSFVVSDISNLTAATLDTFDLLVLGEMTLSSAQAGMLTTWVNAGGRLIAMRPDKKLAELFGLTDQNATMSDAYLLVNTGSGPGAGIVGQTIQYHGTADLYSLSSASSLATLYSSASTATSAPAVTLRSVGGNGGQAAAFTYDLARSIVFTRQGNPDWAGQERDGYAPIRSDDLFYGNAKFDPHPDWVDFSRMAIPQADEQQRLLANMIIQLNATKKPLPRFWYFPRNLPAVVVMTGDDHGYGGTIGRFEQYKSASPAGCSVENWECVRSTSYIYPNTPISNAQAASYNAAGFDISLHITSNCGDYTPTTLRSFFSNQLSTFRSKYYSLPAPATNRTHCIVWSDYSTQPVVELENGMRLDATYYYWPPSWVGNIPGFFTGSGMPMRFAKADGSTIDVYQATTQMTDESGQEYPYTINALLDLALGPKGYYAAFVANAHTDFTNVPESDAIVSAARSRGVPVISARQLLEWLDGRNSSSFTSISFSNNCLSFTVSAGQGARGLIAMTPIAAGQSVTRVLQNGSAIPFDIVTIKGIRYARFSATNATYQVYY